MVEQSLVLMKTDALQRGIVGEILHRFERAGLKMVAVKLTHANDKLAEAHYPGSQKWYKSVGEKTLADFERDNKDPVEIYGTSDPIGIGKVVRKWNEEFLKSGPVIAIVFEGVNAVSRIRALVGHTFPANSAPGTIRGDFSLESVHTGNNRKRPVYNLVHASGSVDEAKAELKLWFKKEELFSYRRIHEDLYQY